MYNITLASIHFEALFKYMISFTFALLVKNFDNDVMVMCNSLRTKIMLYTNGIMY